MAGAEVDAAAGTAAQNAGPDGAKTTTGNGAVSQDTSTFRSGVAGWRCSNVTAGDIAFLSGPTVSFVDGRTYFLRAYFSQVSRATTILRLGGGTNEIQVNCGTSSVSQLFVNGVQQGSNGPTLIGSTWSRVELKGVATATNTWTAAELLVDGVSVATWSGSVARTNGFSWGGIVTNATFSMQMFVDDVALNDDQGASNNSFPGDGAVLLLVPTADSAVGTGWVLGANTAIASNGFGSVDNCPPLGVADLAAGSDPKQIRNATSAANSNYDATMTTYTAAGVTAGATVNAVQPVVATAAPVTTSSKQGTVGVVSNPAITNIALGATGTSGAFWGGATAGTYGAGWKWSFGTMTALPSVTLGTAPVMRITQVTASTRIAMVCFMGMYVDYSPAVVAAARAPTVNMAPYVPA